MLRLALNVATTRLILSQGHEGPTAAGHVVAAFGGFLMGGDVVIGLILFSILGQCVMVTANELIMIFIGLECSSIASYVLAGYLRDDKRNNESAQVLPPRLVQLGDLPLRARLRLGPDRDDLDRRRRLEADRDRGRRGPLLGRARDGARLHDDRRRLQDRRRPVPLLDARRLPGLADAGDRHADAHHLAKADDFDGAGLVL